MIAHTMLSTFAQAVELVLLPARASGNILSDSGVMEVVELKVRLHCKACEKAVRKALCKIRGVTCVEIDVVSSKITVLGYIDRKVVVKAVRKTGRRAEERTSECRREKPTILRRGFVCIIPGWGTFQT